MDAVVATVELAALTRQARRAYSSARAGVLCLALGIGSALFGRELGLAWLLFVCGLWIAASACFHCRSAWLEMRFVSTVRACVRQRWRSSVLSELAVLRCLCRDRLRAATAAWLLAGMVTLLIWPVGLAFALPAILKVHAAVLALCAVRLPCMAIANRRLLRELDERSRDLARSDVVAM